MLLDYLRLGETDRGDIETYQHSSGVEGVDEWSQVDVGGQAKEQTGFTVLLGDVKAS